MVLKSTDQQGNVKGTRFMTTFIFHTQRQQKTAELMPLATGSTKTCLQDSSLLKDHTQKNLRNNSIRTNMEYTYIKFCTV